MFLQKPFNYPMGCILPPNDLILKQQAKTISSTATPAATTAEAAECYVKGECLK